MATITFKIDGVEISASSVSDAAELIRALQKKPEAPSHPTPPTQKIVARNSQMMVIGSEADLSRLDADNGKMALDFLKAIRDSDTNGGVSAPALMKVFGVTAPKGLGSKSAAVNKVIKMLALKPGQVYKNPKTSHGRTWKPGRRIGDAIQMIEQRLGQQ